jgi:autotransporter translocation and assembly factor TamB
MEKRRSFIRKSGLLLAAGTLPLSAFSKLLAFKKSPPESVVVTLYVNTAQIDNRNVNASCNFGQAQGISNEEFTIDVNVGDNITWQGVSANAPSTDIVNIVSINHEGGKNVFGENILKGNDQNPQKVTGTALYKTDEGKKYKYKISFTVMNGTKKRNGMFHIDPKIEVH